ncbi:MAG: response regulator transcription factor [Bacteroidales bacterium]|nr:response regulator transcription factor [Bacteroidales bacterium]
MRPLLSVLVVEPSTIVIEGLKVLLDEAGGFNMLAPLHDATILTERLHSQKPDLLIINPALLAQPVATHINAIARQMPNMPIVALVYQYFSPQILQSFSALLDICENRAHVASLLGDCCNRKTDEVETENYELTEREVDVLVLLAQGFSSKEIADQLNISIHTVNTHRKNITHKTGIKSVAGLAVYATLHNFSN